MKGKLVIIIGPSGAGKTELVKALIKSIPNSTRLITSTSRAPRPGEGDGRDFHFLSKESFEERIKSGDFIEYAETHGNLYGSSGEVINKSLREYDFVFAIIDVKGAQALKKHYPDALAVFIDAGSIDVIKKRIVNSRKNITDEELQKRLKTAEFELQHMHQFDAILRNPDGKFKQAVEDMTKLLI